jgi:hypothetical protein
MIFPDNPTGTKILPIRTSFRPKAGRFRTALPLWGAGLAARCVGRPCAAAIVQTHDDLFHQSPDGNAPLIAGDASLEIFRLKIWTHRNVITRAMGLCCRFEDYPRAS